MTETSVPKKYFIRVNTDIYALGKVQLWFQQFKDIPQKVWLQCNLALTEGFTNVVCHAHEHLPEDTPIDIEVLSFDKAIEIRIWDLGQPFDLIKKLETLAKQNHEMYEVEDIPTGGRGLIITKAIADQLSYERSPDGRNCLMIRKNYIKEQGTINQKQ